jgi:hypothetical protein
MARYTQAQVDALDLQVISRPADVKENGGSGVNPKSEIRNPKSEIRNPKSEIRNPKSEN